MKTLKLLMVACFTYATCLLNAQTGTTQAQQPEDWTDGNGGTISTLAELRWLSETSDAWDEVWELGADINAAETRIWNDTDNDGVFEGFSPIGTNYDSRFTGDINGKGFTIDSLYIFTQELNAALIGYAGGAQIDSLNLSNYWIAGENTTGAIVGFASGSVFNYCTAQGNLSGNQMVGPFAYLYNCTLSYCLSIGHVNSRSTAGGLVGMLQNSTVANSYSTSSVITEEGTATGGLVGGYANDAFISNCYASGLVHSSDTAGGLCGIGYASEDHVLTITSSYYDFQTTGQEFGNSFGTPLSTEEFADQANFVDWEFENTWQIAQISSIDNNKRPHFKTNLQGNPVEIVVEVPEGVDKNYGIKINGADFYEEGESVTISLDYLGGYTFNGWKDESGAEVSSDNEYTFTMPSTPITYTASLTLTDFAGGEGTESSPYQIESLNQLAHLYIDYNLWDKHFVLNDNIDATTTASWNNGQGLWPIGNHVPFSGSFNGNGNIISNIYIDKPYDNNIGLFGVVDTASISGLVLEGGSIKGFDNVGSLIGLNQGSTIESCFTSATVQGNEEVGGLIGNSSETNISKCGAYGAVTGGRHSGGILGYITEDSATVTDCFASAIVNGIGTTNNDYAGSFVGGPNGTFTNCYSAGELNGRSKVFMGLNYSTTYENCFFEEGDFSSTPSQITELSIEQFADAANFTGWDFENIWVATTLGHISLNKRPYLQNMLSGYEVAVNIESDGVNGLEFTGINWYDDGEMVTLTVSHYGYDFNGWYDAEDNLLEESNTYSFEMPANNVSITAKLNLAVFSGGDGSEAGPYQIENLNQLARLSIDETLFDKHFEIISDIDASGTETWYNNLGFLPIGDHAYGIHSKLPFTGSINGNNHTISNISINRSNETYVGLFGSLDGASIQNITFDNLWVEGKTYVGGLAYTTKNNATLFNCTITNGTVKGYDWSRVAGLVNIANNCIIDSCSFSGVVNAVYSAGGLVQTANSVVFTNCSASGLVSGEDIVGGLVADMEESTITNCYTQSMVIGSDENTGGLVGECANSEISACYSNSIVKGYYIVGGLIGYLSNCQVEYSYSTDSVMGYDDVGGLIGLALGTTNSTIQQSYSTSNVEGSFRVGGFIGYNASSYISNCFASGTVSASHDYLGGFAGVNLLNISNSYCTGMVSEGAASSEIGGFVGDKNLLGAPGTGTATNCYWDIETSGQSESELGEGLNTADFADVENFNDWDFDNTWLLFLNESVDPNNLRPYLLNFMGDVFAYSGGDGSSDNPYVLSTFDDLKAFSFHASGHAMHFVLANDIDASASAELFAGKGYYPVKEFEGTFDGQGFAISNLTIKRGSEQKAGFFAQTRYANIMNLGLNNCYVSGNYDVGALIGSAFNSSIANCYSSGYVYGAGLIGSVNGDQSIVTSCYSNCNTSGSGLINDVYYGAKVENCFATGLNIGSSTSAGLIRRAIGSDAGTVIIKNSYASGYGDEHYMGGGDFIGDVNEYSQVNNCYYDSITSGAYDNYATPITYPQFASEDTFTDWSFGTDSISPWVINENGRPYLYWQKIAISNKAVDNNFIEGSVVAASNVVIDEVGVRISVTDSLYWDYQAFIEGNTSGSIIDVEADKEYFAQLYVITESGAMYFGDAVKFVAAESNTLSFDANGGEGSMESISIVEGGVFNLPANAFTYDGYLFVGWATSADGAVEYDDEAEYTMGAADATLYAVWEEEVSVNEAATFSVNVYPNPFNKTLHLSNIENVEQLIIYDRVGSAIMLVNNPGSQINTAQLNAGSYFVSIIMKDGSRNTHKLLKH